MDKYNITKLKKLHQAAFNDSDKYTDFYFRNRYVSDYCFPYIIEEDLYASVTYARLINLCIGNDIVKTPFLNSIATDPNYRYKGYAKASIDIALESLQNKNYPFVILHPFKHSFYENLNFYTIVFANKGKISKSIIAPNKPDNIYSDEGRSIVRFSSNIHVLDHLNIVYNDYTKNHYLYNYRDKMEWELILKEHFADEGYGYLEYENMIPVGYILVYSDHTIREVIARDANVFAFDNNLINKEYIQFENRDFKHTMGKVLSVEKCIYYLPFRADISTVLEVSIGGQSFRIDITSGKVKSVFKISNVCHISLSEEELLLSIFGKATTLKEYLLSFNPVFFDTY